MNLDPVLDYLLGLTQCFSSYTQNLRITRSHTNGKIAPAVDRRIG